jgi:hypothetical protein
MDLNKDAIERNAKTIPPLFFNDVLERLKVLEDYVDELKVKHGWYNQEIWFQAHLKDNAQRDIVLGLFDTIEEELYDVYSVNGMSVNIRRAYRFPDEYDALVVNLW